MLQEFYIKTYTLFNCSYSFELNPNWSRSYSHQPEILRYLERVADKYDITRHIELGKRALNSKWDDTKQKWRIQLDNGEEVTANVVVSGVGALHIPSIPEFPGAESFKGPKFHSARWQKDFDPTGKRVAIIGTGASAVQIVPSIAKQVKTLTVFQRTPCWVPPKDDFAHPKWLNFLFKMYPPLMYCLRLAYFLRGEFGYMMFFRLEGFLRGYALKQMKKYYKISVKDPEVRAKLTPSYEMGCKRVTPSNHYLRSFNRENVTLVTEKIQNFTESGIETVDGTIHEFDCIVYATGFDLTKSSSSVEVYGQNSKNSVESKQQNGQVANGSIAVAKDCQQMSLGKEWADFPNAYKGITTPGYPNLFFLLGPGTGLGHNSVVFMIECQVTYTIDAIKEMVTKNVKSIAVKSEVNTKYQSWVQEWMKNKVFNSPSCVSWYKNTQGVNYTLWPSHLMHYWWVTRYVDLEDYHCKW